MNNKKIISLIACTSLLACNSGGPVTISRPDAGQILNIESGLYTVESQRANNTVTGVGGIFDLVSGFIAGKALDAIWGAALGWIGLDSGSSDPNISKILQIVNEIQKQISTQTNLIWQAYQAQTGAFKQIATAQMGVYFQDVNLLWLNVQSSGMNEEQANAWINGDFTPAMEQELFHNHGQELYYSLTSGQLNIQTLTSNIYYISGTNSSTMEADLSGYLQLILNAGIEDAKSHYPVLSLPVSKVRQLLDDYSDTNTTENTPPNNAFAALYYIYQFITGVNGQVTQYLVEAYEVERLAIDLYYSGTLSKVQQDRLKALIGADLNTGYSQETNINNLQKKYVKFAENTNSLIAGAITNLDNIAAFTPLPGTWADTCDNLLSIDAIAKLDPKLFIPSEGKPPIYYYDGSNTLRTLCKNNTTQMVTTHYSIQFCGAGNPITNSNGMLTCANMQNVNQETVLDPKSATWGMLVARNSFSFKRFDVYWNGGLTYIINGGGHMFMSSNSLTDGGTHDKYVAYLSSNTNIGSTGYNFGLIHTGYVGGFERSQYIRLTCLMHDLSCKNLTLGPDGNSTIQYDNNTTITLGPNGSYGNGAAWLQISN